VNLGGRCTCQKWRRATERAICSRQTGLHLCSPQKSSSYKGRHFRGCTRRITFRQVVGSELSTIIAVQDSLAFRPLGPAGNPGPESVPCISSGVTVRATETSVHLHSSRTNVTEHLHKFFTPYSTHLSLTASHRDIRSTA
jgi:hypothetical protein